jgi:hypothetical protein
MFTRFNTRRPNHLLHKHCETEPNMAHLQTDGARVFSLWHNEGLIGYHKRPGDPAQLAKLMIDFASGDVEDREPSTEEGGKTKEVSGSIGGKKRAASVAPEKRAEISRKTAAARWRKAPAARGKKEPA